MSWNRLNRREITSMEVQMRSFSSGGSQSQWHLQQRRTKGLKFLWLLDWFVILLSSLKKRDEDVVQSGAHVVLTQLQSPSPPAHTQSNSVVCCTPNWPPMLSSCVMLCSGVVNCIAMCCVTLCVLNKILHWRAEVADKERLYRFDLGIWRWRLKEELVKDRKAAQLP